ncbi:MAG: M3 family oligoendopeptidase [Proteobacteria bacterium]|nr:M3 family oligoendopeptidase [Pseudomonadota bacterium]MBU1649015.1 M3 family oligoendopeptidase [Pseudomonadota bacterium]
MTKDTMQDEIGASGVLWNLGDLYGNEDDPAIAADIQWCTDEAQSIRGLFRGQVATLGAKDLLGLVVRLEALDCRITRLATFAFLNFTTQMENSGAGALEQRIEELASLCKKDVVFFELEWNVIPSEIATRLLAAPELAGYRHYLEALRRYLPHQLSEAEESLLLEYAPVGRSSWNTLFDKVLSGLRFGEKKRVEEEVLTDLHHQDREVRRQAAADLTAGLQGQSHILTHIFNTLAADKMIDDRLRRHESWVHSMNLDNELTDATVETLVQSVTSRYDIVQRYYRVKKELLHLDELTDYDRYAPLPALTSKMIGWDECKSMVLHSFGAFSGELAAIAERFFTEKWIHAPVIAGKRGGAFAHPCVPEVHPYVMVNYTGTLNDVSTVAHELGHGVHQVLAAGRGHFNSDTPLVLAETASVFAEMLVFQSQLALLADPAQKRAFICQKLESIFATVFRQTAMNRFEKRMHEGRHDKGELSSELLSEYWLQTQREMFGDSVTLRPDYGIWWSYIPHFLATPGYVYSYAFGELLVLALYGLYLQHGDSFVTLYTELLAAGGSASPYELVKPFGINLDDPEFWLQGLRVIDGMLQQVENLSADHL